MAKGEKTGGRQKGSLNKTTTAVREALTTAFEEMGGVASLVDWGRQNETEFYRLWSKLIPQESPVTVNVNGLPLPEQDKAMLDEYAKAD